MKVWASGQRTAIVAVQRFFPGAKRMRQALDSHFEDPYSVSLRQFNWNYWYVPNLYAYFRSLPESVFSEQLTLDFYRRLQVWSIRNLGLAAVSRPTLSLYVNGCGQALHNDVKDGKYGYVFSLTKWDTRTFVGGETLIYDDLFEYALSDEARLEHLGTCRRVPALFNQLLVFDDRLIHGVAHIQGQMDPREGRVVLQGHMSGGHLVLEGALDAERAQAAVTDMRAIVDNEIVRHRRCSGLVSLRLGIQGDGKVQRARVLLDNLVPTSHKKSDTSAARAKLFEIIARFRFPASGGRTTLTLPIELCAPT